MVKKSASNSSAGAVATTSASTSSSPSPSVPSPDWDALVRTCVRDLPKNPEEGLLQGRVYDLKRELAHELQRSLATQTEADALPLTQSMETEDRWYAALPPLLMPPVRQKTSFSAWRTALLAILGLLLGSALGQGVVMGVAQSMTSGEGGAAVLSAGLGGGLVVFCGLVGVVALLSLAEFLLQSRAAGRMRLAGKVYRWKRVRRAFTLGFGALLALAVVRDFWGVRDGISHLFQSLGLFLSTGQVLQFFSNIYGLLFFALSVALLIKRPLHFDAEDFSENIHTAARQWWAGASVLGPVLLENMALKHDQSKDSWQRIGAELYSLAHELPEAHRQWLEERLRSTGLLAQRQGGALTWSADMQERYTPLGYIEIGDLCYEDEPPLMEQGVLVRKGTVRKVRG